MQTIERINSASASRFPITIFADNYIVPACCLFTRYIYLQLIAFISYKFLRKMHRAKSRYIKNIN